MTSFATFGFLYMAAVYLELAERWAFPVFTAAVLGLIVVSAAVGITRKTFLIFLFVTTAQLLAAQLPDVANHVNLMVFCNLMMTCAIAYSMIRSGRYPTDDDCFAMMRPLLQTALIVVYWLAGFHKINADFINPQVSCVSVMADGLMRTISPVILPRPPAALAMVMIVMVLAWELSSVLLVLRSFQRAFLAFSWIMHASFALMGFVDFAALALALLFTFVPRPYAALLNSTVRVPVLGLALHRTHLYLAINVVGSVLALVPALRWRIDPRLWTGILFNAAALVFMWKPLVTLVRRGPKPEWAGVSLRSPVTPRWMWVFPAFLLAYGFTGYLGLRTAGNFSMFSNLRTEGTRSNHLLLAANPFKIWGYQEDVVRFLEIDDARARIGYQYQPLRGHALPVVEFRKLIRLWAAAGVTLPMTFEYRDRIHSTTDIVADPQWGTPERDWEMTLLDFRVIQPEGPNRCRW